MIHRTKYASSFTGRRYTHEQQARPGGANTAPLSSKPQPSTPNAGTLTGKSESPTARRS